MAAGTDSTPHAGDEEPGPDQGVPDWVGPLAVGRSIWDGSPSVPPWMTTELVQLRAAFPEFSFTIRPGWRGLLFEAWRDSGAGGLYAVITGDAGELRRELEGFRVVSGDRGLLKQ
jgi:hypothetical protein